MVLSNISVDISRLNISQTIEVCLKSVMQIGFSPVSLFMKGCELKILLRMRW